MNESAPARPAALPAIKPRDISTTFAKGLSVLRCFDGRNPVMTMAEIAALSGLDRATTRRLVLTLAHEGYLYRSGRGFSVAPRVLEFAGGFLQSGRFGTRVQPVLDRISAQIDSTVTLSFLDAGQVLLAAQSTLQQSHVTFGFTIGSTLPLLHTAQGRALLSMLDDTGAEETIAAAELARHTAASLPGRAAIRAEVSRARQAGYAIVDAELENGIIGFAVPVRGIGPLPGVIGAARPRAKCASDAARTEIIGALQICASELGRVSEG